MSTRPDALAELMAIVTGYQRSRALMIAAELGIADLLRDGPRSVDDLAQATQTHPPTLYRLLRALAAAAVFKERPGRVFALTPMSEFLRSDAPEHPEAIKGPLTEVIQAADTVQLGAVRKDALAAVEELKTKGSDSRRNLDFWGQVGVGALALGCVSAAALGQVEVGIPCVIGGSASQGLLSFWEKQQ